ncbi:unnamed protein product [Paramecium pentaurelia]|uniref:Dynein heavy chain n=1 Tax=Paramecium pentaurelia TaxID=43138 RepID=A0A8S1UDZ7_9CILI|nr:unnamed protein product [Paramecium pentaurelia]
MSQKRMTIAPIFKAQLPKINFSQAKKEQLLVDELLLTQQHFHDSRELVNNIINEKNKEAVNQSFQDQQVSYQAIKQKLEPTKEIFQQKIITKPVTRQARSNSRNRGQHSMIITIRDDSNFQWMNDLCKKNLKTNLPKPARNPVKIQENFSRLSNRKNMSFHEKVNDEEMNFELQGLNTNKTLKNYLTWDDPQTPTDIIQQFKNDKSYHAKCPFYEGNGYVWTEVQILDYDQNQQKFIVKIMKNDQIKYVSRLSLMLKTENETEFNLRLQQCRILQKQAEEELRFFKYVNSIPDQLITSLPIQTKINIKKKLKLNKQSNIDFEQIEYEYKLFMKKFLTLQRMNQSDFITDFIQNRIKMRNMNGILQKFPKLKNIKKDFQQVKQQISQSPILNNKYILQTFVKIQTIKEQSFELLPTNYPYGQLPFVLSNLEAYNQQMYNVLKLTMFNNWRTQVIQDVQDSLRSQFNFYQTDDVGYQRSQLCLLLKRIDQQFSYLNMKNLVEMNITKWVNHIKSFTEESENLSKEPFIQINIVIQQIVRKKTVLHKQSTFGEERYMIFEPTRQQIIQALVNPIQFIKDTVSQVKKVENDIMPLIDIGQALSVQMEQISHHFDIAIEQIVTFIDNAMKLPNLILDQFNEFSYLYTKSQSHLMKRLFGDSKEKPAITYIELDKIKEKLNYYLQTIFSIERLCIDEKNFSFFQVKTKQAKLTLIQKSQEIINGILNRLSEVLTDNISRISKLYQDMCERILEEPKEEHEMVQLKNFIAETEVNLAKLANEVNMLFQTLDLLHQYQYQYDNKEIENLWFLKQWPAEIRIALVEGQRNVHLKETKFTEKLDQEKELFIRELLVLENQVEEIKFYEDYSQVKTYAQNVMGLKEKINNYQDKVRSFNDRENLFKQPLSDYDDLIKIKQDFEPFYKIWDLAIEFDIDKQEWYQGQFMKLQYSQIERKMIQYYQKETLILLKYFQDQSNDKALRLLNDLKKDLDKFKEVMWLIEFLNCEAIQKKPKIWDEIYAICGYLGDDITLNQLLEHNYLQFKIQIEDISKKATYSYDIEKRLNAVVDKCKEIKIEFIKNSNIMKIDETQILLDEQLNTILLLKQSPYVVMDKAIVVERKIILIQDTLENWRTTQKGYIYLQPIFQSEDIRKKLPQEKNKFDFIDRFWKQITENFQKDPLVWENIENERYKQESKHCNDLLDYILKGLSNYLEQKRKVFPRFFFLSDDGLLEILAQTKEPLLINRHIQKCYEGIYELLFDENNENILNIISPEKDIINLYKSCNVIENDKYGNVEKWLQEFDQIIIETIKRIMKECAQDTDKQWYLKWPSQCVQTMTQVKWTSSIEQALISQISLENVLHQIKQQIKNLVQILQQKNLNIYQRIQISQIIILLVHNRTQTESLCKIESLKETDFNWLINLRFYDEKILRVSLLSCNIQYGFEYYGLTQRLVITPLTDRCYRTLIMAFQNNYGGAPEGPAGTGKTETVKDLAKCLGIQCIVFNCSEGLNVMSMSKFFKGLICCGAWCCFDEFNRIDLEVLSVVAQQIIIIQQGIKEQKKMIYFETDEYFLNKSCQINITMNPGYVGRYELPDNLKILFRPCAMIQPDYQLITEIFLYSIGFQQANYLSNKIIIALQLSQEQLSTQDHYDFGMRSLKSVLLTISQIDNEDEEIKCIQALMNVNLGKLINQDIQLFNSIIQDLFPNSNIEQQYNTQGLSDVCLSLKLDANSDFIKKCIQMEQLMDVRHGIMIIGETMSGKSQLINVLAYKHNYIVHKINPKALLIDQLFGKLDRNTKQFYDGVIPIIFRQQINQLIVFDGPVDTQWVENLNTVLDDNKKLCLTSGEIIRLYDKTQIIFETSDLQQASPATVTRCGMLFMEQLQWRVILDNQNFNDTMQKKALWLFDCTLGFLQGKYYVPCTDVQLVQQSLNMMKTFNYRNEDQQINVLLFCILWVIGGICDENQRKTLNSMIMKLITASNDVIQQFSIKNQYQYEPQALHLRFMEPVNKPNLYDFYFDVNKNCWLFWNVDSQQSQINQSKSFDNLYIKCIDTIKTQFWINQSLQQKINLILIGQTGSGKTIQIQQTRQYFQNHAQLQLTFSGQTQINYIQQLIENKISQRRCKGHYGPEENKAVCSVFIDDLSMNEQPNELIRQHIDTNGWYDIETKEFKHLEDTMYICATQKQVNQRFMRHFMLLYVPQYSHESLIKIFNSLNQWILNQWGQKQLVNNAIIKMSNLIVNSTIRLFNFVKQEYLATPSKCHYIFNLRDVWKVFKGIYLGDVRTIQKDRDLVNLWQNECQRVFSDRMIENEKFNQMLLDLIQQNMKKNYEFKQLYYTNIIPITIENQNYTKIYTSVDQQVLREYLNSKLDEYQKIIQDNNIVLFEYAINHIIRIIRGLEFGNMLLIGLTGSGRQSLSNLSSYILYGKEMNNYTNDKDELQSIIRQAGLELKNTIIYANCNQINNFNLEQICNLINFGEMQNLYTTEDKMKLIEDLNEYHMNYLQFVKQTHQNLHFILSINPNGEQFRNRIRLFPTLINNTTIDWFTEWPQEALIETQQQYDIDVLNVFSIIKKESQQYCKQIKNQQPYLQIYQPYFLEFLKQYKVLYSQKQKETDKFIQRYTHGVDKILQTESDVTLMKATLQELHPKLHKLTLENSHLLINLQKKQKEADLKKQQCEQEEYECTQEKLKADQLKQECQDELDKVLPILAAATSALEKITNEDMIQLKSFQKPPLAVSLVMEGMCYIFDEQVKWKQKEPGSQEKVQDFWEHAKKNLLNDKLIKRVRDFKEEQIKAITPARIQKIKGLQFDDKVFNASKAAGNLSLWIKAVVDTFEAYLIVDPKQILLKNAIQQLQITELALKEKIDALKEILRFLNVLQNDYNQAKLEKDQLQEDVNKCQIQLERAEKLISGLIQEKDSWRQKANQYKQNKQFLQGDCILSSAIITFFGPFPLGFRESILEQLKIELQNITFSSNFSLLNTLCNQIIVGQWINQMKLPNDQLSIDNAIIIQNSTKWVLLIDPQNQGSQWLLMWNEKLNSKFNFENCMQIGHPVLLQEPDESQIPFPCGTYAKLNDKKIEMHPDFRLFIQSKNPLYSPEICIHLKFINFEVTQEGLEDFLLNYIVSVEEPQKEEIRQKNIRDYYENKNKQQQTEDSILKLLHGTHGNILEDETLILTLQKSKNEQIEIEDKLKKAENDKETFQKISNQYKNITKKISIIYLVIRDLQKLEFVYVWSLEKIIQLFDQSIKAFKSVSQNQQLEKNKFMFQHFTKLLYTFICQSLLEKDKLTFTTMLFLKILLIENIITQEEINFLLNQHTNYTLIQSSTSCPEYLTQQQWNQLNDYAFQFKNHQIVQKLTSHYFEFINKNYDLDLKPFHLLIITKIIKPYQFIFQLHQTIEFYLGQHFTIIPQFNIQPLQIQPNTPILFILSSGSDPLNFILREAGSEKIKLQTLSLGQGQNQIAELGIQKAIEENQWIILQNLHLAKSFIRSIEQIYENQLQQIQKDSKFRLFLTTNPIDTFSIKLLQKCEKFTFEYPKGYKNNLLRIYSSIEEKKFNEKPLQFKCQLYGLAQFHAIVLERRKFGNIGWNCYYDFSQADLEISQKQLLDYDTEGLKYLISELNYGGRVIDNNDRLLLKILLDKYLTVEDSEYPMMLNDYLDQINALSYQDDNQLFGLHLNAQINQKINETNELNGKLCNISSILNINDQEEQLKLLISTISLNVLQYDHLEHQYTTPLNTILIQECCRFNKLIIQIKNDLEFILKSLDGLEVMNQEMEQICYNLLSGVIPSSWLQKSYFTTSNLINFVQNLQERIKYFQKWIDNGIPELVNISYFFYPQTFLTGVKQDYARKNSIPVDTLNFEFKICNHNFEGYLIEGLLFDQCQWDEEQQNIVEPQINVLYSQVPLISINLTTQLQQYQEYLQIPVYSTKSRNKKIMDIPLKTNESPEFWIIRGVAIICSN